MATGEVGQRAFLDPTGNIRDLAFSPQQVESLCYINADAWDLAKARQSAIASRTTGGSTNSSAEDPIRNLGKVGLLCLWTTFRDHSAFDPDIGPLPIPNDATHMDIKEARPRKYLSPLFPKGDLRYKEIERCLPVYVLRGRSSGSVISLLWTSNFPLHPKQLRAEFVDLFWLFFLFFRLFRGRKTGSCVEVAQPGESYSEASVQISLWCCAELLKLVELRARVGTTGAEGDSSGGCDGTQDGDMVAGARLDPFDGALLILGWMAIVMDWKRHVAYQDPDSDVAVKSKIFGLEGFVTNVLPKILGPRSVGDLDDPLNSAGSRMPLLRLRTGLGEYSGRRFHKICKRPIYTSIMR
ncbi:hypothetical protein P154DRAFT_529170 [Amniculicola lignicola CBS 123094]|uniref:Uncharacterized protein n=1 Tax=Amniculicola lignicola CBS 123094 TaxID=1392246 RepID=A0A6A5X3R9_9PLEO|nr:hypothetical protein P154DRAFT_529170 [Amniculicola lignicola CBS 123094]